MQFCIDTQNDGSIIIVLTFTGMNIKDDNVDGSTHSDIDQNNINVWENFLAKQYRTEEQITFV